MQTFHGAWPALITPFTKDDAIAVAAVDAVVDYLLGKGVDGFYLLGSTGQGIYQSVDERKLVTETALRRIDGRVPAIVHVGCQALPDAVVLARHAERHGASGVSSIIPAGFSSLDSIARFYAAVAAAVPALPFLPYLFTGDSDAVALIEAMDDIPNLAGAKYTGPNMYELRHVIQARTESWSIFSGMDEQCLFSAMVGTCGNIGSTLNFIPGVYRQMRQRCDAGDVTGALDLQMRANRVTAVMIGFGFMAALYEVMRRLGLDCGRPRLPVVPLSTDERDVLYAELDAVGFDDLVALA